MIPQWIPPSQPKNKPRSEQLRLQIQFSENLVDTRLWIMNAEDLEAAAGVLEKEIRRYWGEMKVEDDRLKQVPQRKSVQGQYLMLMAYALENYFKAILIHRNMDSLSNYLQSKLPPSLKVTILWTWHARAISNSTRMKRNCSVAYRGSQHGVGATLFQ